MTILRRSPQFEVIPRRPKYHSLILVAGEPFVWADEEVWFEVPVGFYCDGASVPNLLYPLLGATALDLLLFGLGHDYLYRSDAKVIDIQTGLLRPVHSRKEADSIGVRIASFTHITPWDCKKIFYGLRAGGNKHWHLKEVSWYSH